MGHKLGDLSPFKTRDTTVYCMYFDLAPLAIVISSVELLCRVTHAKHWCDATGVAPSTECNAYRVICCQVDAMVHLLRNK